MAFFNHWNTCYREFKKTVRNSLCFASRISKVSRRLSCDFISGGMLSDWFSGQFYNFNNLAKVYKKPAPIQTQRSNIYAEHAITVMQEVLPFAAALKKLILNFF